jgi:hypothetical protein
VEDDGQGGGAGNRLKMRADAGLHWLVVVGHDRQHRIGAGPFGAPRQLDGLLVEFDPAPAMTRARRCETSTAVRTSWSCSSGVRVEASPVVSPTTIAETPASI